MQSQNTLPRLTLACSAVTTTISTVALVGWLLNWPSLTSIRHDYIPMAPSTALAFIILSGVLFTCVRPLAHPWGRLLVRIGVLLISLECLLVLLQFFTGLDLGFEQLLLTKYETLGAVPTGRMSPITAVNLFLAALAIGLLMVPPADRRRTPRMAAALATIVVSAGLVIMLGYLHGTPLLYGETVIPVALTTATAFVFLGVGIITVAGPEYWPLSSFLGSTVRARMLKAVLPIVVAVILVSDWLQVTISRLLNANPALISALVLVLSAVIVSIIVSKLAQIIGGAIDRTEIERKRAEVALRESEARYKRLVESLTDYIYTVEVKDGQATTTSHGPGCIAVTGYTSEEYKANPSLWLGMVHEEDRAAVLAQVAKLHAGETPPPLEHRLIHKNGFIRWVKSTMVLRYDEHGQLKAYDGLISDITERKLLEAQLLQSQKIEAVGTLAGGIAHDFNNLLTALIVNLELARAKIAKNQPAELLLEEIETVTQRAATLTQQLLAFSRRQILQPVPLNLNNTITTLSKMLTRLIGEHIELDLRLAGGLGIVKADPGQMEQVIMNLCVNARDAMPQGGKLTLATRNIRLEENYINSHSWVEKGDYVLLEITDTGCGMDKATMERIFEPFFTTKEVGKGTGLGLAMVFGIVKQHEGYINAYSEPDQGTTFKIYLPRIEEKVEVKEVMKAPEEIKGGQEIILLAEDEEQLREAIQNILEMFGYTVLTAKDGREAVEIYERERNRIDMVILDAVMPRMGGTEAAEYIHKLNPLQKILFSSGYTAEGLHEKFIIPEKMHFIQKPYTAKALAQKVREVLEGQ